MSFKEWKSPSPYLSHELGMKLVLEKLKQDQTFADLTIVCGTEKFHVHRAIICLLSPYFKGAIGDAEIPRGSTSMVLQIPNLGPETMRRVIEFIYSGSFNGEDYLADRNDLFSREHEYTHHSRSHVVAYEDPVHYLGLENYDSLCAWDGAWYSGRAEGTQVNTGNNKQSASTPESTKPKAMEELLGCYLDVFEADMMFRIAGLRKYTTERFSQTLTFMLNKWPKKTFEAMSAIATRVYTPVDITMEDINSIVALRSTFVDSICAHVKDDTHCPGDGIAYGIHIRAYQHAALNKAFDQVPMFAKDMVFALTRQEKRKMPVHDDWAPAWTASGTPVFDEMPIRDDCTILEHYKQQTLKKKAMSRGAEPKSPTQNERASNWSPEPQSSAWNKHASGWDPMPDSPSPNERASGWGPEPKSPNQNERAMDWGPAPKSPTQNGRVHIWVTESKSATQNERANDWVVTSTPDEETMSWGSLP